VVCRYGGEEFAIILPGMPAEVTQRRVEFLRNEIKYISVMYQGQLLDQATVSAGVSVFPGHGENRETLMRATDKALYCSKKTGRNCVTIAVGYETDSGDNADIAE